MKLKKLYTLVFIRKENEILLGMKKRGFGCNKWNGFGGKVESHESIVTAATRELMEECRLTVKPEDMKNVAHLEFTFENDPCTMDVRVFTAAKFVGEPTETEEMSPKWFKLSEIPFDSMWPDDRFWFPVMLSGTPFYGQFLYRGFDTILSHEVKKLRSMEEFYISGSESQ